MFNDISVFVNDLIAPHSINDVLLWFMGLILGTQFARSFGMRLGGRFIQSIRSQPGKIAAEILKQLDGTTIVSTDYKTVTAERCEVKYTPSMWNPNGKHDSEEFTVTITGQTLDKSQLEPWEETRIKKRHRDIVAAHSEEEATTKKAAILKRLQGNT